MGRDRGQVTIEGVLILGFFILIFVGITFPSGIRMVSYSNDIAAITEAKNNLNVISSALEMVASGQKGTVRTITITSNVANWEINTNAPMDGINPTPKRPVLNYEVSIWGSNSDVPGQLYRIRTSGNSSFGAVVALEIPGVSTGEANGLGQRSCSHTGGGTGSWDVRIENAANSTAPYIVFDTADPGADCTASNTTINMYLVG
jgi:type II secretory pathway pseudopilin PulG